MKNVINKKEMNLLANKFKKIGVIVMALAFLPGIIIKFQHIQLIQSQKENIRTLSLNGIILGLLLIALSKDKIEDEMSMAIRLRSMSLTLIWSVLYVIIKPLGDIFFNDPILNLTVQHLVMSMLCIYLITYYQKKLSNQ